MGVELEPSHPSFLIWGPLGSGLNTALKVFRGFRFLTLGGISLESIDRYLMMAEAEGKPLALTLEMNPFYVLPSEVKAILETLKTKNPGFKVLYLSASTEILIQRFSTLEKEHPYEHAGGIQSTVEQEQSLYRELKSLSDYHIDTGMLYEQELERKIAKILGKKVESQPIAVHLTSFGFKKGIPLDAEMIFDMRFLPNPFYNEELRPKTGLDKEIQDYVLSFPEARQFLEHWQNLLSCAIPMYQQQGKAKLAIGIGCTGGQHRSVVMTMLLSEFLQKAFPDSDIRVTHREQSHWPPTVFAPNR